MPADQMVSCRSTLPAPTAGPPALSLRGRSSHATRPGICLLAALFAAVLSISGCIAVSNIDPSFGGYAQVDTEFYQHSPALTIQTLSKGLRGTEYGPLKNPFYIRPGIYNGFAVCNRPVPAEFGNVPVKTATADAPARNFELDIDAPGFYQLDCDYTKDGMEVIMKKLSDTRENVELD